ncbi:MAG TPA: glycosyl hydrolase [Terracidiphilus sp.]|nr:glycosyl hydrolase [Terracidiphilus sp.]
MSAVLGGARTTNDALRQGFENPPEAARPPVWWHWLDGNVTREGIKLDLEWMHRTGLSGFQAFDASPGPTVVRNRLVYPAFQR